MSNNRILLHLIVFLTGISALIYQTAWVRQVTLTFGVGGYTFIVVLAALAGGMALSSRQLGSRADTHTNPLRLLARLHFGIGLLGLVLPFLLAGFTPVYGTIVQSLSIGSVMLNVIRVLLPVLLLIPPAYLLGAVLPIMVRSDAPEDGLIGQSAGRIYATLFASAAVGCGVTGLLLLPNFGTQASMFTAVGLNILACAVAWWLSAQPDKTSDNRHTSKPKRNADADEAEATSRLLPGFVAWAYALSGFVAVGCAVVWARILTIFTAGSGISISIVLATLFIGIAIGAWLGAWRLSQRKKQDKETALGQFVDLLLWLGLSTLGTLFIFSNLPRLNLGGLFQDASRSGLIIGEFLVPSLALLVPAIFIGMLFPVAISLITQERCKEVTRVVGRASGLNAAGAFMGCLLVGFGLIPLIGLQASGAILACLSLIMGFVASWIARVQGETSSWLPHAGIAVGIVLVMLLPEGTYLGFGQDSAEQLLYYGEGAESTVAVVERPEQGVKTLITNGQMGASTDADVLAMLEILRHLPLLLNPEAERALMLGFGHGIATGVLNLHDVPQIEAVAPSEQHVAAAAFFASENQDVLDSADMEIYVEDDRQFLEQTPHQYGIITSAAGYPIDAASWTIFTHEFYALVNSRLTNDGVFLQRLSIHNLAEADYRTIVRTFQAAFPHATLFYTGDRETLLLATPTPLSEEMITQITVGLSPEQVLDYVVLWGDELRAYTGEGRMSTDNSAYFLPHANASMFNVILTE